MPRRNIGRPRPNFRGVTQRFNSAPVGGAQTGLFLKVADNGTPWTVPAGVHLLRRVWALGGGKSGSAGTKGADGGGAGGGSLALINNYVVTPGQLINFNVGSTAQGSWFAGTVDQTDAPLFGDTFQVVDGSVGNTIILSNGPVGTIGGEAGGFFTGLHWIQLSNSENAALGDQQVVLGGNGNVYGGGGAGGALGGGAGGTGAVGIIVIDIG